MAGRPRGSKNNPERRLPFRQKEVARIIRAAKGEGVAIGSIEVVPKTGIIRIIPAAAAADDDTIPWDKALKKNAEDKKRAS